MRVHPKVQRISRPIPNAPDYVGVLQSGQLYLTTYVDWVRIVQPVRLVAVMYTTRPSATNVVTWIRRTRPYADR